MKRIKHEEKGSCFKVALCSILELEPTSVPNFSVKYKNKMVLEASKWLERKFNKTLVYVSKSDWEETAKKPVPYNTKKGPVGYSIGAIEIQTGFSTSADAVVCKDGKIVYDARKTKKSDIKKFYGYFVIVDMLTSPK